MAQALNRRPLNAEARIWCQVSACEICGGQSVTGTGFFFKYFGFLMSISFHRCSITHLHLHVALNSTNRRSNALSEIWEQWLEKHCQFLKGIFSKMFRPALGPIQPRTERGITRPGRDTDNSSPIMPMLMSRVLPIYLHTPSRYAHAASTPVSCMCVCTQARSICTCTHLCIYARIYVLCECFRGRPTWKMWIIVVLPYLGLECNSRISGRARTNSKVCLLAQKVLRIRFYGKMHDHKPQ
jgi:hypothetical protein